MVSWRPLLFSDQSIIFWELSKVQVRLYLLGPSLSLDLFFYPPYLFPPIGKTAVRYSVTG